MKKQFSDSQTDDLMRSLASDAGADDETVNDVADSPTLWWGVQRQIATQKDAIHSPWPPAATLRRWLMIGAPVAGAILLAVVAIMLRPGEQQNGTEVVRSPGDMVRTVPAPVAPTGPGAVTTTGSRTRAANIAPRAKANARSQRKPNHKLEISSPKRPDEVRSEFIALSYAGSPESGQMVRVKVPRSMMVTLGLVAAVDRPNSLVDADVVVGDDGMTHAIRFIR
jgi:hypothetical protein